jgi:hypothetical protein
MPCGVCLPTQVLSSPQTLETQGEKAEGQDNSGTLRTDRQRDGALQGPAHLVLWLPRVQQLKPALEKLVVSVQWVWHLLHSLLLPRGCLQGLGQLDVCQYLRRWAMELVCHWTSSPQLLPHDTSHGHPTCCPSVHPHPICLSGLPVFCPSACSLQSVSLGPLAICSSRFMPGLSDVPLPAGSHQ